MHRIIALTIALFVSAAAQAATEEGFSRALQQAKRVAVMENSRDLPSRAVWLSNRVVKKSRELAQLEKTRARKNYKRPTSIKN